MKPSFSFTVESDIEISGIAGGVGVFPVSTGIDEIPSDKFTHLSDSPIPLSWSSIGEKLS